MRDALKNVLKLFLVLCMGIFSMSVFAQSTDYIKGTVKDKQGEPLIGATVGIKGTQNGTITDVDGNFELKTSEGKILEISYIGYKTQDIPIGNRKTFAVVLDNDAAMLDELVVIGYGSVKKKDLSGSVVAINAEQINKGAVTSPQELLQGKVSGLFIQPGDGQPGSGATMRIRSGASLNSSNDPLIVIDGVPVENNSVPGVSNALATINPNDIASFSVLKDASATAIYGSRASNGVIIITTKKGTAGKLKIDYASTYSFNDPYKRVNTLNAAELRAVFAKYYPTTTAAGAAADQILNQYPKQATDWQNEIFRTGFGMDQNLSFSGKQSFLPYRLSMGYNRELGTLVTSKYERYTGAINLSPKFFNNRLSVDLNVKGTINNTRFADAGSVGSAAFFDPTKPVYGTGVNDFLGYWNVVTNGHANTLAPNNPLSMLYDVNNAGTTRRSIGNLQLDYKTHFLPELRANLNVGYDVASSTGNNGPLEGSFQSAKDTDFPNVGRYTYWDNLRRNQLLEFYLNYNKYFDAIKSNVDVTGGYSFQHFYFSDLSISKSNTTDNIGDVQGYTYDPNNKQYLINNYYPVPYEYYLISFFGRMNYNLMDRYLVTATLRDDGSSRFSSNNRWGLFPSVAFAWTITNEKFMKHQNILTDLKLRLGYGQTGQQDIFGLGTNDSYYGYLPNYVLSANQNSLYLGNYLLKPLYFNKNLKWEQTATYNIGVDYGFLNNRINGSIDVYRKKTTDLLNIVSSPAGTGFSNQMVANVGSMENKGVEFNINAVPVDTKDFTWNVGYNITWNTSKILQLTASNIPGYPGQNVGNPGYGTGLTVQKLLQGYAPYTFYLYQQVYDKNGKPIQNALVDRNGDGQITEADRYMTNKSPTPKYFMGFSSSFRYKDFDLGFNLRANIGNYVFNAFEASNSTVRTFNNQGFVSNLYNAVYKTGFTETNTTQQLLSDYFLKNASFLKMDNLTLGYSFNKFLSVLSGRLSFSVQNVFTITKYDGLDPENSGIDNSIWPRPRTYTVGLNLNF